MGKFSLIVLLFFVSPTNNWTYYCFPNPEQFFPKRENGVPSCCSLKLLESSESGLSGLPKSNLGIALLDLCPFLCRHSGDAEMDFSIG
jgi:hypothetical protein